MEFLLLLIAWALKLILSPLLFVYSLIRALINDARTFFKLAKTTPLLKINYVSETLSYFKGLAIIFDVLGNVMGKYIFNDALQRKGYGFGNRIDTISYALGRNEQAGTLTGFGKFIGRILDLLDKNHLKKSIKNKA